ncbi:MAG: hypothetical protein K1X64_02525 [Myxococcaceae bacterium]|nr:hypothetical protein [Myxococcaceae bacterium]
MNRSILSALAVSLVSTGALAADVAAPSRSVVAKRVAVVLQCPAGARQITTPEEAYCSKGSGAGNETLNGPFVEMHANGVKAAEGNYVEGNRDGHWVYYDESGKKRGEIDFKGDHFHGRRVVFAADGKLQVEEQWVMGKRQGASKSYDADGKVTITQFKDDLAVAQ